MASKKKRRKPAPKVIYALFDAAGDLFDTYESREDAEIDAVGPRFRPTSVVREYWIGTRKTRVKGG